jgi:hypothetical protein
MWGDSSDPRDLSQCNSWEDFIKKIDKVQAKLFTALRKGGRLAVLVGDIKKRGL